MPGTRINPYREVAHKDYTSAYRLCIKLIRSWDVGEVVLSPPVLFRHKVFHTRERKSTEKPGRLF